MVTIEKANANLDRLRSNIYPGRGIVIGQCATSGAYVEVYWIMGRSENSRNRIFLQEQDGTVRTEVFDKNKPYDPALTIYNALRQHGVWHVVTNGAQTDTIVEALARGEAFKKGLEKWTYEPDAPNFTPRISGVLKISGANSWYALSALKCIAANPRRGTRQFFVYDEPLPGFGHCITTYAGDGNPLPAFDGEPLPVPIEGGLDQIAVTYWNALNADNRVALVARMIDPAANTSDTRIINRWK